MHVHPRSAILLVAFENPNEPQTNPKRIRLAVWLLGRAFPASNIDAVCEFESRHGDRLNCRWDVRVDDNGFLGTNALVIAYMRPPEALALICSSCTDGHPPQTHSLIRFSRPTPRSCRRACNRRRQNVRLTRSPLASFLYNRCVSTQCAHSLDSDFLNTNLYTGTVGRGHYLEKVGNVYVRTQH